MNNEAVNNSNPSWAVRGADLALSPVRGALYATGQVAALAGKVGKYVSGPVGLALVADALLFGTVSEKQHLNQINFLKPSTYLPSRTNVGPLMEEYSFVKTQGDVIAETQFVLAAGLGLGVASAGAALIGPRVKDLTYALADAIKLT